MRMTTSGRMVWLVAVAAACAGPARAQLTVAEDRDSVTVACTRGLTWRAVVDGAHGGVIRAFHLPADGPNLVATEDSPDFRGLCNAFFMSRVDRGSTSEDRVKAKGTLWRRAGNRCRVSVVSRRGDEVVVEVRGSAGGWRLLGPRDERVVEYRQTFTYRPDRIVCDGELRWVYGHGTRLVEFAAESFLAPGTVIYPVTAGRDGGPEVELSITSSHGAALPAGLSYPVTIHVDLRSGYRLDFRALEFPPQAGRRRWYNCERPWQQDWAQYIGLGADDDRGKDPFPEGQPVHYRYEIVPTRTPVDRVAPRVEILSPRRGQDIPWGGTIDFAAEATDADGHPLPPEALEWRIFTRYSAAEPDRVVAGARTTFTLPAGKEQMGNREEVWAVASARDARGRVGRDYVKVNAGRPANPPAVPFAWRTATPESQGMSSRKLGALRDDLAARKTTAFLVMRNDRIVYEWYADGWAPSRTHYPASLAKAVVGGLSLAVALTDGRIRLDDRAADYIPRWRDDPMRSRITIRQLGSHTSGLDDAEEGGLPHNKLTGWKGDFWKALPPPDDSFTIARDRVPVVFEPGTRLRYSNPAIAMLTYAVTATLRDTPHKDIRTLLRERVMRPIGVPDNEWACGYGKPPVVDGLTLVASWGGGAYTARALARVGRLLLRGGDWDGRRILSEAAVRQVINSAGLPGDCGMGWWTNSHGRYPGLPKDAVYGAGAGDQVLLVVPSLDLIMVRQGDTLVPPPKPAGAADNFTLYHDGRAKVLFEPLIEAVTSPYPPSPVVTGITWSPSESVARAAPDSDIWATTWADDGHLYSAYGDGHGFAPRVPEKLSLGLCRIEGGPDRFAGVNLRSASIEQKGDGPKGKKPSGLLMVDGVLYMWVRNAGNAQLAWSADHSRTWTWADWKFTDGFGCPTFLNYGPNYAGARDGYVYVFSHDSDSAYRPADRVALARVPKDRIRERDAYEFFAGLGEDRRPVWSREIGERGAVFSNPGKCYRVTVSYDAGLGRYLLCQAGSDLHSKVGAGFGIYDAPEPWGPWTTVINAAAWDISPGETCSFPTKWMSPDGKTLHLIFSGGDSFAVRRATLVTAHDDR